MYTHHLEQAFCMMQVEPRHKALMLLYATSCTALNWFSASRFSAHLPELLLKHDDEMGCAAGIVMLAILCIGYPCAVMRSSTIMRKIIKVSLTVYSCLLRPFTPSFPLSLLFSCLSAPIHMQSPILQGLAVDC